MGSLQLEETEQLIKSSGEACDVVIEVFTCIKIVCDRVRNMVATLLTTITTIWKLGLTVNKHQIVSYHIQSIFLLKVLITNAVWHKIFERYFEKALLL